LLKAEPLYFRQSIFQALNYRILSQYMQQSLLLNKKTGVILLNNVSVIPAFVKVITNKDLSVTALLRLNMESSKLLVSKKVKTFNNNVVILKTLSSIKNPLLSTTAHTSKVSGAVLNNYSHPFHLVDPSP